MAATGATAVALAPFTRPRIQPDVVARSPPTTGVRFASHPPTLPRTSIHLNEASLAEPIDHCELDIALKTAQRIIAALEALVARAELARTDGGDRVVHLEIGAEDAALARQVARLSRVR